LSLTSATISVISVLHNSVLAAGYGMAMKFPLKTRGDGEVHIPAPRHNRFLSFQFFNFDDHLWCDGSFMIEHGVGEGMFGNGPYFSGDAEGEFVDCFDGSLIEERFGIVIDESEDLAPHFQSMDALTRFICAKAAGQ